MPSTRRGVRSLAATSFETPAPQYALVMTIFISQHVNAAQTGDTRRRPARLPCLPRVFICSGLRYERWIERDSAVPLARLEGIDGRTLGRAQRRHLCCC